MRISGIAWLPVLALPLAMAHEVQPRVGHAVARHNEAEYMKRQGPGNGGGVLGPILGGGGDDDDDTTSSTTTSSLRSTTISSSAGSTTIPPSSAISTTSPPASSGTASGSSLAPSGSSTISGSISSNSSSTTSAANSTSSAPPSSSQAPSMSTSIDAQGQTIVITQTTTQSASLSTGLQDASVSSSAPASGNPSGISTGAIIGISVAAGIVVLSLIGCALWRMKKRGGDEDEAIRWPELNRHGDSDAHHALPARQTGQHGIETSPLERSLSNSSSVYHSSLARGPSTHMASTAMALNGSNFGAANSLDYYDEKAYTAHPQSGYDAYDNYALPNPHGVSDDVYGGTAVQDDYSSMPPPMQHAHSSAGLRAPGYSSDEDELAGTAGAAGVGARQGAYGH